VGASRKTGNGFGSVPTYTTKKSPGRPSRIMDSAMPCGATSCLPAEPATGPPTALGVSKKVHVKPAIQPFFSTNVFTVDAGNAALEVPASESDPPNNPDRTLPVDSGV